MRAGRPAQRTATAPVTEEQQTTAGPRIAARGLGLTRRALVFLVVGAMLLLSYASSLRLYLRQQSQITATQQSIAQRQQSIDDLQQQVKRWQDPAYVTAQARNRLGWVLPGEIGYQVIGADGKVLSPSVDINAAGTTATSAKATTTWWQKLSGSIGTADNPTPAASASASATPTTITPTTTPTPSPSSTPTR